MTLLEIPTLNQLNNTNWKIPYAQNIWVRVNNDLMIAVMALVTFKLSVEKLPLQIL
jgi:hypothetical protein